MKFFLTFLLLTLTALPAFAGEKESAFDRVMRTGVLRCGFAAWPPYFEIDQNTHEVKGSAKPFYDAVASLLDIKIEYVEANYAFYLEDLKAGRFDAFCNDGPYTISLAKQVNYVRPWFYAPVFAYGRIDETRIKDANDFNQESFRFIGLDGDLSIDLKNRLFPNAKLISMPQMTDPSQMFLDIIGNRVDAVIIDVPAFDKFNKNNPDKLKVLHNKPLAVYPVGLSVLKSEHELWQTLNTATEMAINMGLADQALKKLDSTSKALYPINNLYEAKQ